MKTTERRANESIKLVETIARMRKDGEEDEDGIYLQTYDDAFDTLQTLIAQARTIVRGG